jgi:hypothetical protein
VAKAEENLLQYSQELNNAYWSKTNSTVTANSTTAPDGNSTADSINENSSTGEHRILSTTTAVSGNTYVLSVFVKQNSGTRYAAVYQLTSANGWAAYVDLSNGNLASSVAIGSGVGSASVSSIGNGWYRVIVVFTATSTSLISSINLSNGTTGSYTGDGTSSIYAWGAQLEQRSSVTAYTATTTAPITNYIPALQSAASGVARFEHNPVTGESLGLEIEEQRTNLLTYSEDWSNATWTKTASTITANTIVAPDGTLTGDSLNGDGTSAVHNVTQFEVSSQIKTASIYAKKGSLNFLQIYFGGYLGSANFDLNAGTVSVANGATGTITPVGNGWYRCTCTANATSATTTHFSLISSASSSRFESWTTSGNIFLWGAMLEAGSFATSYIPTVASQVTRSADNANMTGTNFSSWFNENEGTLYSEAVTPPAGGNGVASLGEATGSYRLTMQINVSRQPVFRYITYSGSAISTSSTALTANASNKTAYAYAPSSQVGYVNGSNPFSVTSLATTNGGFNRLEIGFGTGSSATPIANTTLKKIAYYPKRLQNSELQALTTV